MPFDVDVFDDPPLAHLRGRSPVTPEELREGVNRLVDEPRFAAGVPVLWDMRAVVELPEPGRIEMRIPIIEMFARDRRVALVTVPGVHYGVARQISALTNERVQAFADYELAMMWLKGEVA